MGAPEKAGMEGFDQWLSERPKWLQTAAAKLAAERKFPDSTGIKALADLCLAEANGTPAEFEKPPVGFLGTSASLPPFRLRKLDKVVGVNAIRNNACLDFGEANLALIFGMNGSGKSGYARLLKQTCGARNRTDILPNVFSADKTNPSCEITVSKAEGEVVLPWSAASGPVPFLQSTHVFDTAAAEAYVDSNNEASYEPRRMRFLSSLIRVSDAVAKELATRKDLLQKLFPPIPTEYTGTAAAIFVAGLKWNTALDALYKASAWSAADDEVKHSTEASLKQLDLTEREKQLAAERRTLELFQAPYGKLRSALSHENATKIAALRADAAKKRKAASEDAAKVFADSALDGIGGESWRLLWEQARKFSESTAYPDRAFPAVAEGDLCVLCHQPLDEYARGRLAAFESFVKGGLEASATSAEKTIKEVLDSLPAHFDGKTWAHYMEYLKVGPEDSANAYEMMAARLKALPGDADTETLPAVDWSPIDAALLEKAAFLDKEMATLAELRKEGKKAELEKSLKELKARHWLSLHKETAAAEIARLGKVKAIEKAETITKTNAITSKKNELAKEELAAGYRNRFLAELKVLGGGRLKVEPVPVPEGKGKVSFKLSIIGAAVPVRASVVLSEGENRIVALAAFLADITGSGLPTPFIFDDPVSSLDQEFEERVVERLVALSKTRQVIVFTHRLSLLALIEDAAEAEKRRAVAGEKTPNVSVVSLRRIAGTTGSVDEQDVRHKKPKSGFTVLRDHKLPRIRKHAEEGNIAEHDSSIKALCGDFRILIERSIEKVMLDGVMERFRRSVQTLKIKSLAKITVADCALIDEMMTKYSRYEHSQSDELAAVLPTPDEITEDLNKVMAWVDEFTGRVA